LSARSRVVGSTWADLVTGRVDRLLISNDTFRKEVNAEFRDMRAEFAALRSEMRSECAEMRADIKQLLTAVNFAFSRIEQRLGAIEATIFKRGS
jgi:uncharacterized protein involved in exopolysaccharide biosynthesis